jgi:hypothetical protein
MFNPRPEVRTIEFGPADDPVRVVVVDDALLDPWALVDLAVRHRAAFAEAPHNAYPGIELPLPDRAVQAFVQWFGDHAQAALGLSAVQSAHARLAMVTRPPDRLSPLQRLPHRDRLGTAPGEMAAAGVLYLFDDASLGGTAFYSPRVPRAELDAQFGRYASLDDHHFEHETGLGAVKCYPHAGSRLFDWLAELPPAFNRAIFYDGGRFHCSQIEQPERLSDDPARGRLTMNLFMTGCRTNPCT